MNLPDPMSPTEVMQELGQAIPEAVRRDAIIVGSLAAGYHFFARDGNRSIRSKDVDFMFSPHAIATTSAQQVTEALLQAQWHQRQGDDWNKPGTAELPPERLPLVRLQPPSGIEWFIELLSAPASTAIGAPTKQFHKFQTSIGYFSICSFSYLALAEWQPLSTQFGLRIARPEMMALANMLHHETIREDRIAGSDDKRSNKDLGRAVALAYLTIERDRSQNTEVLDTWAPNMWDALREKFPDQTAALARRAGNGLQALIASPQDMNQALAIANKGLLASMDVNSAAFQATARRLMAEVIEPLKRLASG